MGEDGEVDFKEDAKFAQHMKVKGEAVSDFAKSKSLSEQRQYLPIYSVREDLLQVRISLREFDLISKTALSNIMIVCVHVHFLMYFCPILLFS